MNTTLQLDHHPTGHPDRWLVRALLKLQGEPPRQESRTPLNLSVVLDRSGSMSGPKLEAAKEAATLLVRRLWPEDRVSVVAYDDAVATVAPPSTADARIDLPRRIAAIHPGGTTNLSGGWLRGRELVEEHAREGGVNRVVLLTDGLANVGLTEPAQLEGLCRMAAGEGISTTTIGFGEGYDEHLLRAMADAGGGNTYYIERPDQAPGIFAEEVEGLLSLAAQNVTVDVHPSASVERALAHHDYPSAHGHVGFRLELGDVYAREPRPLLLEFLLTMTGDPSLTEVADVVVTAHVLTEGGGLERRQIRLPIRFDPAEGPRADPEVRRELVLLEAAKARRAALEHRDRGEFDEASGTLREVVAKLSSEGELFGDPAVAEEAEDLRAMAELFESQRVSDADAKYLFQRSHDASRGRRSVSERISRSGGNR